MSSPTCDMDGYDEIGDKEYYWHCEEPSVGVLDGMRLCRKHYEEKVEEDGG